MTKNPLIRGSATQRNRILFHVARATHGSPDMSGHVPPNKQGHPPGQRGGYYRPLDVPAYVPTLPSFTPSVLYAPAAYGVPVDAYPGWNAAQWGPPQPPVPYHVRVPVSEFRPPSLVITPQQPVAPPVAPTVFTTRSPAPPPSAPATAAVPTLDNIMLPGLQFAVATQAGRLHVVTSMKPASNAAATPLILSGKELFVACCLSVVG